MVYGTPLTVPGDFVPKSTPLPVPDHLRQLREKVETLKPMPTSAHGSEHIKINVPASLEAAQFVYVRRDGKKTPLQPPYDGPYRVLSKTDKYFQLQVGNRTDNVSVDRLKAAVTEGDKPIQVAQPPRRGRPPKVPAQVIERREPRSDEEKTKQPCLKKPSYAEVTSRRGRIIKPPDRLEYVNAASAPF